jgi:uncharacterized protein YbjT (DUF2867 family)
VQVAITGGTGFVGRHIVEGLLQRGHRVRVLARRPDAFPPNSKLQAIGGTLSDVAALDALLAGADAVVHLVGIIVESGRQTYQAVHVEGTRRVLERAAGARVARVVHMSAVGARSDPAASPYHRTKWLAEEAVRASGLSAAIMRPSVINGPGNVPIRTLARMHRWSPVIPIFGDGRFPMQPVWVGDVALAFALAAERADIRGTFELGGPTALTYEEFVRAIGRASGHPRPCFHVPLPLVRITARLFDPLGPAAPITTDQLRMLVEGTVTPANAIRTTFGITPLEFESGLRRFLGPSHSPQS